MEPNKESLIKAIGEFDKLGKDSFLNKYSYGENIKYELLYEGKTYPPKAIWGRAYEFLNEGKDFKIFESGKRRAFGKPEIEKLKEMGFIAKEIDPGYFGEIQGIKVGQVFKNRDELSKSGIHKPSMAGIWGSQDTGAYSIVLSGGYEDDIDQFDYILYTGQGGQDSPGGKQIKDQEFSRGNKALAISMEERLPVRVSRGYQVEYGPEFGYRYDGIYYVQNFHKQKGKAGFFIYRFELVTAQNYEYLLENVESSFKEDYVLPERTDIVSQRIKRNQKIVKKVKALHNNICQVCGEYFEGVKGPISVGAHIQGLGGLHNGPDIISNLLCLCPNHHALFDSYGFYIDQNYEISSLNQDLPKNPQRKLRINPKHKIDKEFLKYHQNKFDENT